MFAGMQTFTELETILILSSVMEWKHKRVQKDSTM